MIKISSLLLLCVLIQSAHFQRNSQNQRQTNTRQRQVETTTRQTDYGFGFPETIHVDDSKKNANNRQPLYLPSQCRDNELFYPGDQHDDWVCDCTPGYVYHPDSDKCYSVFTQGPCEARNYLTLPNRRNIPECTPNPCLQDGRVLFRGRCHTLHTAGPCILPQLSFVVGINVTSLQIDCIKQSIKIPSRWDNEDEEPKIDLPEIIPVCAKGSKRSIEEKCIPSLQLFQLTPAAALED